MKTLKMVNHLIVPNIAHSHSIITFILKFLHYATINQ